MDKESILRQLVLEGWEFERHGKKHCFYRKGEVRITIPHGKKISARLIKMIMIQMAKTKTGVQSGCIWRGAGR
jgi:predicted RNA binding protein YcfA (HicA-like mRNA interferase family)